MKRISLIILTMLLLFIPLSASASALSTGDLMIVKSAYSAPMYASFDRNDSTVITYVPSGAVVMYIASVDRGFCVAYENFVGYIDEYSLSKVNSYRYDFALPDGKAFENISGNQNVSDDSIGVFVPSFPYSAVKILPNQNISTRTGPGTKYTEPGTFSKNYDYTAYYQTTGNSVNWGYVEFELSGGKIRAYTGVKRFSAYGNLPYDEEAWTYAYVNTAFATRYGPGYDYMEAPYDAPSSGTYVQAYYTENNWTMIEYRLSNGFMHRGWVPNWCLG